MVKLFKFELKSYLSGGGELEWVDDPDDLVKVPACGGRVQDGQLQPLVRAHDEHSATGQRDSYIMYEFKIWDI